MSGFTSHSASQSPAGLLATKNLKPWAILKRLRPVKLETLGRFVSNYHRLNLALKLIEKHFPEELKVYDDVSKASWWEVLAHLANLIERVEWFEVNWGALNEAWAWWMESDDEDGEHLAVFLEYIPVTLYGFTEGENIFEFPPMELLHALLATQCEIKTVSAQLLIDAEIYDELDEVWGETERERAWALLREIEADPGRYPEPVRWLPELARWACHCTGNVILDRHFDPYQDGPWFTWAADLEEVKQAWRRAQPVIQAFHRVMQWSEADSTNIAELANFIMQGGNIDAFDW